MGFGRLQVSAELLADALRQAAHVHYVVAERGLPDDARVISVAPHPVIIGCYCIDLAAESFVGTEEEPQDLPCPILRSVFEVRP